MKSFIPWVGGKKALAKTILALAPVHERYVELFGGAAWVLFAKEPAAEEVYNDLDGRLIGLFRSVKEHPDEFGRQCNLLLASRELFDLFGQQPGMTEIQRGVRFYFLLKTSFGSRGVNFGMGRRAFSVETTLADVEAVRRRLARVLIEHRDFEEVARQYDGPGTFLFADPPYWDAEDNYKVRFAAEDHDRLRAVLGGLEGKWLWTYNDVPEVRALYKGFCQFAVEAPYFVHGGQPTVGRQIIISNFRPAAAQVKAALRALSCLTPLTRSQTPRRKES